MEFSKKDFEMLYQTKIKNNVLESNLVTSSFFFCYGNKILFIKKARNYYAVMQSAPCGFKPKAIENCFQEIFYHKDLSVVIQKFVEYVHLVV